MTNISIEASNLGKYYLIGHKSSQSHYSLRDKLSYNTKHGFNKIKGALKGRQILHGTSVEQFWALKDICFSINEGEVVGIIGRNGAGKSTLLKLLSRITDPSLGRIEIRGRIASLLEVGTGFHPELTGRENVYLNGAILGMSRSEVKRKFDDIVDFAEVEQFLDTPVKRYSSGMYVRLAFAVAAHLEPEILVVDEVLAVGDAGFQKKCLGLMGEVSKTGRTVLFVSHNMGAIEKLCPRTILLDKGKLLEDGKTKKVISKYMSTCHYDDNEALVTCKRTGSAEVEVTGFHFVDEDGAPVSVLTNGEDVSFVIEYVCHKSIGDVSFSFSVHATNEMGLFLNYSHFTNVTYNCTPGEGKVRCTVPNLSLTPKDYLIGMRIQTPRGKEIDYPRTFFPFSVKMGDYYKQDNFASSFSKWGYYLVNAVWHRD